MMLFQQIRNRETLQQLDGLREDILNVAMRGNVELFNKLQRAFLNKKNEIIMRYEG